MSPGLDFWGKIGLFWLPFDPVVGLQEAAEVSERSGAAGEEDSSAAGSAAGAEETGEDSEGGEGETEEDSGPGRWTRGETGGFINAEP